MRRGWRRCSEITSSNFGKLCLLNTMLRNKPEKTLDLQSVLCYNPLTNAVYPPPPCYPYQQPAVAGSNPVGHTIEIPTPTGMGISQSVEKAALPLLIDMHETIVAERW